MDNPGTKSATVMPRSLRVSPRLAIVKADATAQELPVPLTVEEWAEADNLICYLTVFRGLADALLSSRPKLYPAPKMAEECAEDRGLAEQWTRLADLYDRAQAARGDGRRAVRL